MEDLSALIDYLLRYRNNILQIIEDIGPVEKDNGFGTLFLKPTNPKFTVFWINTVNEELNSIGFGGPNLGLSLDDLYSKYPEVNKAFSIHDNEYIYVFYSHDCLTHTIKITSPFQLFENGRIIHNISIRGIEIKVL